MEPTFACARRLDAADDLREFRQAFYLTPGRIYLDGNSLGLLSRPAEQSLLRVLEAWKTGGIDGWTQGDPAWFTLAETLAALTAPLLGADRSEIAVTNSTTVNLHQCLATLYDPTAPRTAILADTLNFPSDHYALTSHLRQRGRDPARDLRLVSSQDGYTLDEADIIAAMTESVQMVVLPSVIYHSGQLLDMERLTREARSRDMLIGFDCAHSIGAIPHELDMWDVDFAYWCNYKYVNGGPGATGGLYLNRRHFDRAPGLAGWFGSRKDRQFAMQRDFEAAPDAGGLQIGTPNILSLAPLQGALELLTEAGIARIRTKSLRLTDYLMALVETELRGLGFGFATPRQPERRGGHVALTHPDAPRICRALKQAGVIPDFRPPAIVRLAPVALYTSFTDCWEAMQRLKEIMLARHYEAFANQPEQVA